MLEPNQIVPGVNVKFDILKDGDSDKGLGVTIRKSNLFTVLIYQQACERILGNSWLSGKIEIDEFMFGVILHEYAHIKYGSFNGVQPGKDNMWGWIDNVIEDRRIEYRMAIEYPS